MKRQLPRFLEQTARIPESRDKVFRGRENLRHHNKRPLKSQKNHHKNLLALGKGKAFLSPASLPQRAQRGRAATKKNHPLPSPG